MAYLSDLFEGNGSTTELKSCSFKDTELQTGNYNYLLEQIDFDGTRYRSNIISVKVSTQPIEYSLS